jgi:hypothetical protein
VPRLGAETAQRPAAPSPPQPQASVLARRRHAFHRRPRICGLLLDRAALRPLTGLAPLPRLLAQRRPRVIAYLDPGSIGHRTLPLRELYRDRGRRRPLTHLWLLVVVTHSPRGARPPRELALTSASGSGLTTQIGWARLMPCRAPPSRLRAPARHWANTVPAVARAPAQDYGASPPADRRRKVAVAPSGRFVSGTGRGRRPRATRLVKTEGGRSNNAFELSRAVSCHRMLPVLVQEAPPSLGRAAQQRRWTHAVSWWGPTNHSKCL